MLALAARILLVAGCLVQAAGTAPQGKPDPWYGRSARPKDFEAPAVSLGRFTIELPKNWQIVPGHGGMVFAAAERAKNNLPVAAIVLEHLQLQAALTPNDVTPALAEVEVAAIRDREPAGKGFEFQIKDADGRRFIFLQYIRPGVSSPDHVVQYSIPFGSVMYRLICIAPVAELPKYRPVFAHVAASFKPVAAPAPK